MIPKRCPKYATGNFSIPGIWDAFPCPAYIEYTNSSFHFGCDKCNPYSDMTCKTGTLCTTTERWVFYQGAWFQLVFAFAGAVNGMLRGLIRVQPSGGSLLLNAEVMEHGLVWQGAMARMKTTLMSSMTMQHPKSQIASHFHLRSHQEYSRNQKRISFAELSRSLMRPGLTWR